MSTKILLADDHGIIREGLRSLLEKEDGMSLSEDYRVDFQEVQVPQTQEQVN